MTANLASALVAAQAEMPKVEPDAKANYGTYVTLGHLIAKTRPVLNKHGLAISQFPSVGEMGQPVLRTVLIHTSGEQIASDTPLLLQKQDMQQLGGAITYARRYGWAAALGISDQEDDDGNRVSKPAPAAAGASRSAPVSPPSAGADTGSGGGGSGMGVTAAAPVEPETDPETQGLIDELLRLAGVFGNADTVATTRDAIKRNREATAGYLAKHRDWLKRQIKTVQQSIDEREAQKQSQFQIPDKAKGKAA